jgi:ABC-type multidrug transport system ATPase subunit/ABC-type multidrug transport system permease subunit
MVAIMGASGAGKTTLLDVLSRRDKQGNVCGRLCINGTLVTSRNEGMYKRLIGYVGQSDCLIPSLTVRDTIMFAARLKLPAALPNDVITELVEDVIQKLHLGRCAESLVGSDVNRGVSGGEKRRVSIATEIVANPHILFLDEPTSGLDSVSAVEVMRAIKNLTYTAQISKYRRFFFRRPAVIFSIHQPSAEIFAMFDQLVVMSGGRVTYSGPARDALRRIVQVAGISGVPSSINDAETILRMDFEATPSALDALVVAVEAPPMLEPCEEHHNTLLREAESHRRFYPNLVQQLVLLSERTWNSLMGSYYLIVCHACATLFLGVVLSFLYQKEALDLSGTEDKAGMMTFLLLVVGFSSISSLDLFMSEKRLYVIERDNGYYRSGAFYFTKILFDFLPLRIVPSAILAAVTYFPMGLREDEASRFLWFIAIVVVFQLFVTGICLCVATLSPTFGAGALCSALVILWHSAFGGLMMQPSTIPVGLSWFRFLSPFYFAYESLMVNELDGLGCVFDPANAEGNREGAFVPLPCRQFLYNMGLSPDNFNRDVAALCSWTAGYVLLGAVLVHFLRIRA